VIQWQVLNGTWNDIPGATGTTYTAPTATAGSTDYRVRIVETSSGCSVPFSNIVNVTVYDNASVTISTPNPEVCIGGTSILTAVINGGSAGMIMQWQSSPDNTVWTNIPEQIALPTAHRLQLQVPTYYRMVISDSFPNCADPVSNVLTIIVQPDATVTVTPVTSEICLGGTSLLTATITGGSSKPDHSMAIQYQWWRMANRTGSNSHYIPRPWNSSRISFIQGTNHRFVIRLFRSIVKSCNCSG
jgi:hypothetical protein